LIRYLGYACINNTLRESSDSAYTARGLTLKTFSLEKASMLALKNCKDILRILKWNLEHNILFFRLGSELFPFITHPVIGYKLEQLKDYEEIVCALKCAGEFARLHNMRINSHPGPTTLIASPRGEVNYNAIKDLEVHALIGDLLGEVGWTVNFHVGGPYGDKIATAKRYCENFKKLDKNVSRYITVENDDKVSQYTVKELYDMIYLEVGVPIVFDIHHHRLNSGNMVEEDAMRLSFSTWDKIPDIHWSEPRTHSKDRAHADFVNHIEDYVKDVTYDVMLEAKAKEEAVLSCFKHLQKPCQQIEKT